MRENNIFASFHLIYSLQWYRVFHFWSFTQDLRDTHNHLFANFRKDGYFGCGIGGMGIFFSWIQHASSKSNKGALIANNYRSLNQKALPNLHAYRMLTAVSQSFTFPCPGPDASSHILITHLLSILTTALETGRSSKRSSSFQIVQLCMNVPQFP
jgi:hypothetical protein